MSRESAVKYQDEKIGFHTKMVGYYEDMLNSDDIGNRLIKETIYEQISHHARLLVYHKKRRGIMTRGV